MTNKRNIQNCAEITHGTHIEQFHNRFEQEFGKEYKLSKWILTLKFSLKQKLTLENTHETWRENMTVNRIRNSIRKIRNSRIPYLKIGTRALVSCQYKTDANRTQTRPVVNKNAWDQYKIESCTFNFASASSTLFFGCQG